jgi:hypothetical protein
MPAVLLAAARDRLRLLLRAGPLWNSEAAIAAVRRADRVALARVVARAEAVPVDRAETCSKQSQGCPPPT